MKVIRNTYSNCGLECIGLDFQLGRNKDKHGFINWLYRSYRTDLRPERKAVSN